PPHRRRARSARCRSKKEKIGLGLMSIRVGGACGPPPPGAAPLVPRCALLPAATPREGRFARARAPNARARLLDTERLARRRPLRPNASRASACELAAVLGDPLESSP